MFYHTAFVSPVTSTSNTVITTRFLLFCLVILCKSYMKEVTWSFSDAARFAFGPKLAHLRVSISIVFDLTFSTVQTHLNSERLNIYREDWPFHSPTKQIWSVPFLVISLMRLNPHLDLKVYRLFKGLLYIPEYFRSSWSWTDCWNFRFELCPLRDLFLRPIQLVDK